jgi:hypothetical protein
MKKITLLLGLLLTMAALLPLNTIAQSSQDGLLIITVQEHANDKNKCFILVTLNGQLKEDIPLNKIWTKEDVANNAMALSKVLDKYTQQGFEIVSSATNGDSTYDKSFIFLKKD